MPKKSEASQFSVTTVKHPSFISRRNILRIPSAIFVAGIAAICGCGNEECFENKNSLPLAGFYSSENTPRPISLDSISIYGVGAPGDSILHDSVPGLRESYLPFRIDEETTTYVIDYLSGDAGKLHLSDTITFKYESIPWFQTAACGVIYKFKMTSINTTHNIIDSVTCPLGTIDNKTEENLKIFFRVKTAGEKP